MTTTNSKESVIEIINSAPELNPALLSPEEFVKLDSTTLLEKVKTYYYSNNYSIPEDILVSAVEEVIENKYKMVYTPYSIITQSYIKRNKVALGVAIISSSLFGANMLATEIKEQRQMSYINNVATEYGSTSNELGKLNQVVANLENYNTQYSKLLNDKRPITYKNYKTVFINNQAQIDVIQEKIEAVANTYDNNSMNQNYAQAEVVKSKIETDKQFIQTTTDSINKIKVSFIDFNQSIRLEDTFAQLKSTQKQSNYDADAKKIVNDNYKQAETALINNNMKLVEQKVRFINDISNYIEAEVTFKINQKPSGIQRTNNENSNIKNHYLIINAIDSSNSSVEAFIENYETKSPQWVSQFGVYISKDTYEIIKQDKIANGVISNDIIGTKPTGSLAIKYTLIPETNNFITSW